MFWELSFLRHFLIDNMYKIWEYKDMDEESKQPHPDQKSSVAEQTTEVAESATDKRAPGT